MWEKIVTQLLEKKNVPGTMDVLFGEYYEKGLQYVFERRDVCPNSSRVMVLANTQKEFKVQIRVWTPSGGRKGTTFDVVFTLTSDGDCSVGETVVPERLLGEITMETLDVLCKQCLVMLSRYSTELGL